MARPSDLGCSMGNTVLLIAGVFFAGRGRYKGGCWFLPAFPPT